MVADVPGMREAFERVGGGRSPQQLALRPGGRCAVRGGGRRESSPTAPGAVAGRPSAARVGARVPDVRAGSRQRTLHARHRASTGLRRSAGRSRVTAPASQSAFRAVSGTASSNRVRNALASTRQRRPQEPSRDYTHLVGWPLIEEIQPARRAAQGQARAARLARRRLGGGVSEILYTLIPLMRDVGLDTEWHVDHRPRGVLQRRRSCCTTRSRANPQALSAEDWEIFDTLQRDERRELDGRLRLLIVHDPQPAALRSTSSRRGGPLDVALPHRPVDAEPGHRSSRMLPLIQPLRRTRLPHAAVRARRDGRQGATIVPPAIDPLVAEEHGAVARGRGVRLRPVRHRRRPAADLPGVALRSLEGPDGRDRRLPRGQGAVDDGAARAGRLDGDRRPRGLGLLQRDGRPRRGRHGHPDPQQPQQRRRDRGQRVPVAGRRGAAEVDPRGIRADGVARRSGRRGRSSAATSAASRSRSPTASPATSSSRSRRPRNGHCRDPRAIPALGKQLGRDRQGARAHAFPHAAATCATGCASSYRARTDDLAPAAEP